MLAQALYPENIEPSELDEYLSNGWFRAGQTIFTTNFLSFKKIYYSAIWLRIIVADFVASSTQQKLLKQNAKFRVEIKPAIIDNEKENLFQLYKTGIGFDASETLQTLLFRDNTTSNIYNTFEINIYENKNIIACGFFDLGNETAAGITCFYNPAYKKYSLGKYLMLLKILECKKRGLKYFYPGYFVPGYKLFDYKLLLSTNATEYLQLSSTKWLNIKLFTDLEIPLAVTTNKLLELQQALFLKNVPTQLLKYRFFDAALMPNIYVSPLFDYPLFLFVNEIDSNFVTTVIVYDVRTNTYQVTKCIAIWESDLLNVPNQVYATNLLQTLEVLFYFETLQEMLDYLAL